MKKDYGDFFIIYLVAFSLMRCSKYVKGTSSTIYVIYNDELYNQRLGVADKDIVTFC
jgi:hypothetical protein